MHQMKPPAGDLMPVIELPLLAGGTATIGGTRDRHQLFVIYRGKHCPRCKRYLNGLQDMLADWQAADIDVIVASADPAEKAAADKEEFGWTFDLAYDLSEEQMRQIGVYITEPLSEQETDRRFAEPAVYCLRPDGVIQIVCLSNGPAARPDLVELLDGMKFNIAKNRPARGTV